MPGRPGRGFCDEDGDGDRARGASGAGDDCVGYGVPDSVVDGAVTRACLAAGFLPRRGPQAAQTPVLLTLVTFSAAGYFLQRAAPRARSIGEAWRMVISD